MIYAVDEIARIVRPIAQRYGLRAVYLFGSYARGAATEDSDIDLLIDTTGTNIKSLLQVAAVYCELEEALGKPVDLVTVSSLEQEARDAKRGELPKGSLERKGGYLCCSLTDSG